jgi:ribosome-associated protein
MGRAPSRRDDNGPMADDLVVTRSWTVPSAELSERFSRSSGPGGQSVNTTDSRVELSVDLAGSASIPAYLQERVLERLSSRLVSGVLTVSASEHRTQHANRRAARERLAQVLREAAAPPAPPRRPTKPSRRARERRIQDKKRRGETKRGRQGRFD